MDCAHDKRQINMQVEQSPDGTWTAELLFPVVGSFTHSLASLPAPERQAALHIKIPLYV